MSGTNSSEEVKEEIGNGLNGSDCIIVIGASTGGFEAFKTIIAGLPANFTAPIFIVWHMSPDVRGILPQVFNHVNTI